MTLTLNQHLHALNVLGEALTSALSCIQAEDDTGKAYPVTRSQIAEAQALRATIIRGYEEETQDQGAQVLGCPEPRDAHPSVR